MTTAHAHVLTRICALVRVTATADLESLASAIDDVMGEADGTPAYAAFESVIDCYGASDFLAAMEREAERECDDEPSRGQLDSAWEMWDNDMCLAALSAQQAFRVRMSTMLRNAANALGARMKVAV